MSAFLVAKLNPFHFGVFINLVSLLAFAAKLFDVLAGPRVEIGGEEKMPGTSSVQFTTTIVVFAMQSIGYAAVFVVNTIITPP